MIVVQVMSGGGLRINEDLFAWDQLANRLEAIFKQRATKVAFIRGEALVEFAQVARFVELLHGSGISVACRLRDWNKVADCDGIARAGGLKLSWGWTLR